MKTIKYPPLPKLTISTRWFIKIITMMIIACIVSTQIQAQKVRNIQEFKNNFSVEYNKCRGTLTIEFILREDNGTCKTANHLRWIDIYLLDENNNRTTLLWVEKDILAHCDQYGANDFTHDCTTWSYCFLQFGDNITYPGGTGETRKLRLWLPGLPNESFDKPIKLEIDGFYDYEGGTGDSDDDRLRPSGRGFDIDFIQSYRTQDAIDIPSNISVVESACSNAEVRWQNVTPPGGNSCGTVTYDVFRDDNIVATNVSGTPWIDPDPLPSGERVDYKVRSVWTPHLSSRKNTGLPSANKQFINPIYDGAISGTVKTPTGVPIPGVEITATRTSVDGSPVCNAISAPASLQGVTDEEGKFNFELIWYGSTDDEGTHYVISGVLNDNDITTETVELDHDMLSASANLVDNTAFVANGQVSSLMGCKLDSAFVTAKNLNPNFPLLIKPDTTSFDEISQGAYTLVLPGPGNYRFYAEKVTNQGTHMDSLDKMINQAVTDNININYTQKDVVMGFVGGDCGAIYGPAMITARTADGCILATTTSDAMTGLYEFSGANRISSQDIILSIDSYAPNSGPLAGQMGLTQEYEIALDSTTMQDFIFRSPINITIEGLPNQFCSDIEYPILDQFRPYPVTYLITEGDVNCPIDTGYVEIFDDIGSTDDEPARIRILPVSNGIVYDTIIGGRPNILAPYTKSMNIQAFAGPDIEQPAATAMPLDVRVIVVGAAPQGSGFTSISPEIPEIILRDPPGDASYSSILSQSTNSHIERRFFQFDKGGGAWGNAIAGGKGWGIEIEAKAGGGLSGGKSNVDSKTTLTSYTTTTGYSTSSDPRLVGSSGDVYIGKAYNQIFANADILFVEGCTIKSLVELTLSQDTFATTFVYGESEIKNVILRDLQAIADDVTQDPADRHLAEQSISVWNQVLKLNADLKESAFENDANFEKNISFGGSAGPVERTYSEVTTETAQIEWKQFISEEVAASLKVIVAGSGGEGGFEFNMKQEWGGSDIDGVTTRTETKYILDDNTIDDLYTVDIAIDPVFGTPVFRAPEDAGQTSCNYELGRNRKKPYFTVQNPIQYAAQGQNTLIFKFDVGNLSETGEVNSYRIDEINNPDGLTIEISGTTGTSWPVLDVDPGQIRTMTVLATRNPALDAFHFEDLEFRVIPLCSGQAPDFTQAIRRSISAFFVSSCSPIAINSPTNFVVNEDSNDKLNVGIGGYNYNTAIDEVVLEYSETGANSWNTSNVVLDKSDLTNNNPPFTNVMWEIADSLHGSFDLRLRLRCTPAGNNATNTYSERLTGIIDRVEPCVNGIPFPLDDDYISGDSIQIDMDEMIDCAANMTVSIHMAPDDIFIPATLGCDGESIKVLPSYDISSELGRFFEVTVEGVTDVNGNTADPIIWTFTVGDEDSDGNGIPNDVQACSGSALDFKNEGNSNGNTSDYVEVQHEPAFNVTNGDFSFEAWVNPASGDYKTMVSKGNGGSAATDYIFQIIADPDPFFNQQGKLGLFLTNGTISQWQFGNTNIPLNTWSHVAVSVDNGGANPVATFYVNGEVDGLSTFTSLSSSSLYASTSPFLIGRQGSSCNCNFFDGRIDDLAVWNRTLTQAEVMATSAGQLTGTEAGLVAYYDFNDSQFCVDNTGNTLLTDAVNSRNGVLKNFDLNNGCESNWGSERFVDLDYDGIIDLCDPVELCSSPDAGDLDGDLELACADLCPNDSDTSFEIDPDIGLISQGTNNRITLSDPNDRLNPVGNSDFTIEAWVNTSGEETYSLFGHTWFHILLVEDTHPTAAGKIGMYYGGQAEGQWKYSFTTIPSNRWTHIAVSYDFDASEVTFYTNGVKGASFTYEFETFKEYGSNIGYSIGRGGYAGVRKGSLKVDDIMVWNRQLTAAEITATMAAPLAGTESGLLAYYDFNEGLACGDNTAISQIIDGGPYGINGTVRNATKVGCKSNWSMGRNLDSDRDGIGDACDVLGPLCAPDFTNNRKLDNAIAVDRNYETDGTIESTHIVIAPAKVDYDSGTEINLLPGFEVESGAVFHAFIDGCGN